MATLQDGSQTAFIMIEALDPADLPFIRENFLALFRQFLTRDREGHWDGSPLRIVLTERLAGIWDLCVGMESRVEEFLRTPDFEVHQTVQGELWNYWNTIEMDRGYVYRWAGNAIRRGYVPMWLQIGSQGRFQLDPECVVHIPASAILVRERTG